MCNMMSAQEKSDLMKLAKILVLKSTQIILQSRDGNKVCTKCNPTFPGNNSFNLTLKDVSDVDKEVKKLVGVTTADKWPPLCIEMFLKTADGDVMILETWHIALMPETCEYTDSYTLYNRLETLLKSLIAITRVIPAYRYSRRQSPNTFLIHHRVYTGEPQVHALGENSGNIKIGSISMPIGTLTLNVAYRTVMSISPQCSSVNSSMIVKSDHFRPPEFGTKKNDENNVSLYDEPYYNGAFVESRRDLLKSEKQQEPPFSKLINRKESSKPIPVPNAVTKLIQENNNFNAVPRSEPEPIPVPKSRRLSSAYNWTPPHDDFILVDAVNPPFAEPTGNVELGVFYQEWQTAPPLQTCPDDPPVIEQVGDLTTQLKTYESSLKEFDNMVSSLCITTGSIVEETL